MSKQRNIRHEQGVEPWLLQRPLSGAAAGDASLPAAPGGAPGVVLIDPHEDALRSMAAVLTSEGCGRDFHWFLDVEPFLQWLAGNPVRTRGPLCVLCDLDLPGLSLPDLQQRLRADGEAQLVLTTRPDTDVRAVVAAYRSGVVDILVKPIKPPELLTAVQAALRLSAAQRRRNDLQDRAHAAAAKMTPRELEVARRVAKGEDDSAIAARLQISERTVKFHRQSAREKLQLRTTQELAELMQYLPPSDPQG